MWLLLLLFLLVYSDYFLFAELFGYFPRLNKDEINNKIIYMIITPSYGWYVVSFCARFLYYLYGENKQTIKGHKQQTTFKVTLLKSNRKYVQD